MPPTPEPVPEIDIIVDNRDAGFSSTGWWFVGDGGQSYAGDCAWAPRGIQNIAYIEPQLPLAGSYEVYGWWCGDPNGDQSQQARIQIYPTRGRVATHPVAVNLSENAGQWNSLGTYYLQQNAMLSVDGSLDGNAIADAFRFVYRSPESLLITPTPAPTPIPWTNNPPSPMVQLSAGDLHQRLGLVGPFYPHTPVLSAVETTFDDCQAFPRDGCGGQREGWNVDVGYKEMVVRYRVSKDYKHVAIDPPAELAGKQMLYLLVHQGQRLFRVDRYLDDTWHLSGASLVDGTASHLQLEGERLAELRQLVEAYGPTGLAAPEGTNVRLFGLGPRVALSEGDATALEGLVNALGEIAWMRGAIAP